ncbi:MAG: hypothetical protein MJY67_04160, partial [Bacteroidales bacterium]|nr:hypothetical protein [Bacteroidales bacterium]
MFNDKEIRDDEMRVIGRSGLDKTPAAQAPSGKAWNVKKILALVALCVIMLTAVGLALYLRHVHAGAEEDLEIDYFENSLGEGIHEEFVVNTPAKDPLGDYSDSVKAYTEHIVRVVNDIEMDIYIPHNAHPRL